MKGKTRAYLAGLSIHRDCMRAKTVTMDNGDVVCGGLHQSGWSFYLATNDVLHSCKQCGAWHVNYEKNQRGHLV